MIATYHGNTDGSAAVNHFARTAQTAVRLRGYDRSARSRKRCRHAPSRQISIGFDNGGITNRWAGRGVALAPRGPVAGTVDVVKT